MKLIQPQTFRWRHFHAEVILQCVRWYCKYGISYRDLEEMMSERGLGIDHTTLYRWVQIYAPADKNPCYASALKDLRSEGKVPDHSHHRQIKSVSPTEFETPAVLDPVSEP